MPVKHALVSAIADDAVPAGKVQPSDWNDDHDLSGMVIGDVPGLTAALDAKSPLITLSKDTSGTARAWWPSAAPSAIAHTNNAWRAQLVIIPGRMTIIPVVQVSTAVALSKINAGLYFADPTTGLPVNRAYDLGVFDTSTTGTKSGSSVTIEPGEYWFVYVPSGATTGSLVSSQAAVTAVPFPRINLTVAATRGRLESTSAAISPLPATITGVTWTEGAAAVTNPVYMQVQ